MEFSINNSEINKNAEDKIALEIDEHLNEEKNNLKNTEKALLNILEDYSLEKKYAEDTQRALLNILDDYSFENINLENTQRAFLNILEDYSEEKTKVETVNNDLISANKELEQFAFISSHDLQEPLRTITNFVKLIEKIHFGKLDKDTDKYLRFIVAATFKMQILIKNLLDYSRTGRNATFTTVDCNLILKDVISEMGATIEECNAKIITGFLPLVKGNEIELKRLFQNLISNALKFQLKMAEPEVSITIEEKKDEYIFAIKDNGIGIEEQYLGKLFVIFQRLHTTAAYPGTGIGLATCKKIVGQLGGRIWVESKFGEGSVFYFTIPKMNLESTSNISTN